MRAGKPCGIFAFDPAKAARYRELGARFVAVCADTSLLVAGAKSLLAALAVREKEKDSSLFSHSPSGGSK